MIVRLFKGTFSYRTCYGLRSYCRSVLLIYSADINSRLIGAIFISGYKKVFENEQKRYIKLHKSFLE